MVDELNSRIGLGLVGSRWSDAYITDCGGGPPPFWSSQTKSILKEPKSNFFTLRRFIVRKMVG